VLFPDLCVKLAKAIQWIAFGGDIKIAIGTEVSHRYRLRGFFRE
jgi:hypothetical protein